MQYLYGDFKMTMGKCYELCPSFVSAAALDKHMHKIKKKNTHAP